jgi:acyl dehydratase
LSTVRFFEDVRPGEVKKSRGRTVTDADIRMFIGATGDDHPNHTDAEYCKHHPILKGPCVQGILLLGISDAFITLAFGNDLSQAMNYGHDKIRYLRPAYHGDTLTADLTVLSCVARDDDWGFVTVEALLANQSAEPVLVNHQKLLVKRRAAQ